MVIVEENDGKARNRMIGVRRVDLSKNPFQLRTEAATARFAHTHAI